jgi:phosphate/sulfate permease
MLIALSVLAILDLIVGVSNDAINFLNSAIGSKVISVKNIMIIASLGIFLGAATSSGMMEVARKGIFVPGEFYFNEIMFIFMAVMITDVLLLDVFNSLGLPTSTTVSIVFELLGAAVAMAFIKIHANGSEEFSQIFQYINSEKATQIIIGIFLSVAIAFIVGAMVQFISRLIFSFQFETKKKYVNAIFGGIAITAITYFIFMKGLKGTEYYKIIHGFLEGREIITMIVGFLFWTGTGYILSLFTKFNILKFIIGIGTFSLALAFAGNDLVNFIGVPIAALNSYEAWQTSGMEAMEFGMDILSKKVPTHNLLLFLAGGIMIVTLWINKKARKVAATEINLSRQHDAHERFNPNILSKSVIKIAVYINKIIRKIFPKFFLDHVAKQFANHNAVKKISKENLHKLPAFDMIRASVNLVVAGILISIATSYRLPLSTTYVTFMVAMGTSLADRAWGNASAAHRVAGVFNVIGGWFLTALSAFIVSGIFLSIIHFGGITAMVVLLIFAFFIIIKSHSNKKIFA